MALTKLKLDTMATGTLPDANIPDNITITGAQTGITQVGTLTEGTWNGSIIGSSYLDADTAHLSGTQTFSGAKTFTADIQITEAHPGIFFTDSDDNSDSRIYHSAGSLYIDADNNNEVGSSKVRFSVDDSEVLNMTTSGATFAGNALISKANPKLTLTDSGDSDSIYLDMVQGGRARLNTSDQRDLTIQEDGGGVVIGSTASSGSNILWVTGTSYFSGDSSFGGTLTSAGSLIASTKLIVGGTASLNGYSANIRGTNEVMAVISSHATHSAISLRHNSSSTSSMGAVNCYWATTSSMKGSGSDTSPGLWATAGNNLHLGIGSTEKLTVASNGKVTIAGEAQINNRLTMGNAQIHQGTAVAISGSSSWSTVKELSGGYQSGILIVHSYNSTNSASSRCTILSFNADYYERTVTVISNHGGAGASAGLDFQIVRSDGSTSSDGSGPYTIQARPTNGSSALSVKCLILTAGN